MVIERNALILLILLTALSTFDSFSQRRPTAISLVPDRSVAVLRVDWRRVRLDEELKRVTGGIRFPELVAQIGVNEAEVSDWVVFSDAVPTTATGMAIIVTGSFTSAAINSFARRRGLKSEKVGAYTAYVIPEDDSRVMPIGNGLVAAGTKTAIGKIAATVRNPRLSLNGKKPFASVWPGICCAGGPVAFYLGIPQDYQLVAEIAFKVATKLLDLTSFGIVGTIFETIGMVRSTGFSLSNNGNDLAVRMSAVMESETKAWVAAGALNMLKKAPSAIGMRARTEQEAEMMRAVQTISARNRKEVLSLNFQMPFNRIRNP